MRPDSKIYVAGHQGLVGSAIVRNLKQNSYTNITTRSLCELDLTRQTDVEAFFSAEKPEYVFLAAAKVGGIYANNTYPADFMYDNMLIQMNVMKAAYENDVVKLLFLGSSCIYPKMAPQPIPECCLLSGPLEPTNEAYALAKISGLKYCGYMNRQYGTDFISVMPTNQYGKHDNYHPDNSHVIPAMLRRFHEAKISNAASVTIWGTGKPFREFMYADDLADACVFLMLNYSGDETINIGTGKDISIRELAETIKRVVGYKGEIVFDATKPDGTPKKLLDVSKLHDLGWQYKTELEDGLRASYEDFVSR